jgi:hypothetical protein
MNGLLIALVVLVVLVLGGLALSVRIVQQYERGVLVRLGRVIGVREPGLGVDGLHVGEHAQIDAVGPVRLRRSGDQLLPIGDVAGHPVGMPQAE